MYLGICFCPSRKIIPRKLWLHPGNAELFDQRIKGAGYAGELLTSIKGHLRQALAKATQEISLLEAYRAVKGDKPLLHQDTHTNPACAAGINIQLALRQCYDLLQAQAKAAIQGISLRDVLTRYAQKATT